MNAFRQALTPARALLLAAVLLLAQAAGLAHRVAHGGASPASPLALAATGQAAEHRHAHVAGHATLHAHADSHGINGHEQAGTDCRLYDQLLGHADLLPTAVVAGPAHTGTAAHGAICLAAARTARAAAYQARAPPLG